MQRALNELQRTEPLAVNLPPRPYNVTRNLTPAIQGSQCLAEYYRAKRFKLKKEMILYLYYLGEVIDKATGGRRKEYEPHREYLSYHYWKVAIKAYKLFRVVGPKQIFRTSRTFTVTTVGDMTLDEIDAVENMFGVYLFNPGELDPDAFEDQENVVNIEDLEQQLDELQPEVEIQEGESVTPGIYLQ
jgi:hypothetical protein